jgi:hypothetical protein
MLKIDLYVQVIVLHTRCYKYYCHECDVAFECRKCNLVLCEDHGRRAEMCGKCEDVCEKCLSGMNEEDFNCVDCLNIIIARYQ